MGKYTHRRDLCRSIVLWCLIAVTWPWSPTPAARADGSYFPEQAFTTLPTIPTQRALLCYRDGVETLLVESTLDTLGRMPEITCPVVVAHGAEDVRIPLWMGEAVYAAANEPKRFVLVEGGRHSEVLELAGDDIVEALAEMDPTLPP